MSDVTGAATAPRRAPLWALILVGAVAGGLSGVFGVGGGILVVPALLMLGFDQRRAAATSAIAILPTAIVGAASYGITGQVHWIAGALLAIGIVIGAQLGSVLLARLPHVALFWTFLTFLVAVGVSLWLTVPSRESELSITWVSAALLVALGLVTGVLSGVLGVGGGVVVVPALIALLGASDLVAKGTSLLMMVPGSLSASIGHARRRTLDLRAGIAVGVAASVVSPAGVWLATLITPFASNVAFTVLLAVLVVQIVVREARRMWKARKARV